jgi:tRNA wybutosine-synthesizing protein 1
MYPKLNEFLEELHKRKIISFLVTNGQFPEAIAKLNKLPTQLYLSLDAPTKQIYKKLDRPKLKDYWSRLNKTLDLIKDLDMRTVIRITAIKNLNMLNEKEYAKLIEKANPKFVEIKSFMLIGDSRERLSFENMPSHEDIKNFGKKISSLTGYGIVDEKKDSRVVLLMREDKGRFINK